MRQALLLTVGAMALYVVVRWLPIGTNLQHADFQAAEGSGSSLEFCDPANPQFLPVVNVRSPIETRVRTLAPAQAGATIPVVLSLQTSGGKPIGPADLMIAHTRKLHVLAVDPTLTEYLHLHPEPGDVPGEWRFELTPQQAVVIGDQLLTDVFGANRMGLSAILVTPISPQDESFFTGINRRIERVIYGKLRKRGLLTWDK